MTNLYSHLGNLWDKWLGLDETWQGNEPRYRHQATLNRLAEEGNLATKDCSTLIGNLYDQICENWSGQSCSGNENWRFKKQTNLDPQNQSPEVTLERTLARGTSDDWVNQVPTASGVDQTGPHDIDLVCRNGSSYSYTFFELKVNANTPLSAAIQILQYGLVYAFSRNNAQKLEYTDDKKTEILCAEEIHLRVLAPQEYYKPQHLDWLRYFRNTINYGLQDCSEATAHLPVSFDIETFPKKFQWVPPYEGKEKDACLMLANRKSIFSE